MKPFLEGRVHFSRIRALEQTLWDIRKRIVVPNTNPSPAPTPAPTPAPNPAPDPAPDPAPNPDLRTQSIGLVEPNIIDQTSQPINSTLVRPNNDDNHTIDNADANIKSGGEITDDPGEIEDKPRVPPPANLSITEIFHPNSCTFWKSVARLNQLDPEVAIKEHKQRKQSHRGDSKYTPMTSDKIYQLLSLPHIVLLGRSNVGKSTFINALFKRLQGARKLALTSKSPGRTQTINLFPVDYQRKPNRNFMLVDMPGYGFADAPEDIVQQWNRLTVDYITHFSAKKRIKCVFLLIDSRRGILPIDREVIGFLNQNNTPFQVGLNVVCY